MADFTITVPVEDITGTLTLRQYVGEGSYDGIPVELDVALPTYSPCVKVSGRRYVVNIRDIVKAIAEHVTQEVNGG